ncbi:hypothetical protein N9512_02040 [Amylibacter sp.]|nr:hypothetical protein [Amylibacter sp.]MDB4071223.1 hypothetical protein [Amylibacter sp.]
MLSLFKNTVFVIWLLCSLATITVFSSIWALQKTFMVAKLSAEITSNTIKHRKEIKKTITKIKAKARLKRIITMLPIAGTAAGIYFEESEFQEWLIDNPNGKRSDYLCEIAEITSEIIDDVIDDLPQSIKSGENLLKAITPECTKIE